MKKITIALLLLCATFKAPQTYCMKGFGQTASNYFRMGMKTLNMTGIVGAYAFTVKTHREKKDAEVQNIKELVAFQNKIAQLGNQPKHTLSTNTKQSILNFLYDAYPEIRGRNIEIIENSPNGFFVINTDSKTYLLVPFTEQEFNKAAELKEKNMQGFVPEGLNKIRGTHTVPQYIAIKELEGKAMQPTTIDTWKAILLHEASHIAHRDLETISPWPYITILLGTEKIKKTMGLDSAKYIKRPILNNLLKGVGSIASFPFKIVFCSVSFTMLHYWQEYRADQDAIERTTNAKLLHAKSEFFNNLPQFDPISTQQKIVYYLADPHLAHKTRAAYFKKAAEKLEDQHNTTIETVKQHKDAVDTSHKD